MFSCTWLGGCWARNPRMPVNSSDGQLVTQWTRHTMNITQLVRRSRWVDINHDTTLLTLTNLMFCVQSKGWRVVTHVVLMVCHLYFSNVFSILLLSRCLLSFSNYCLWRTSLLTGKRPRLRRYIKKVPQLIAAITDLFLLLVSPPKFLSKLFAAKYVSILLAITFCITHNNTEPMHRTL